MSLLDHCIVNLPTDVTHSMDCHMRHHDCEKKFICALKDLNKVQKDGETQLDLQRGIEMSLFQGNEFRNLLHLQLFYHKATDSEAREWLSNRNVV